MRDLIKGQLTPTLITGPMLIITLIQACHSTPLSNLSQLIRLQPLDAKFQLRPATCSSHVLIRHSLGGNHIYIYTMVGQPGRSGGFRPGAGRKPTAAKLRAGSGLAGGAPSKAGGISKPASGGIAACFLRMAQQQKDSAKGGGGSKDGSGQDGSVEAEEEMQGEQRPEVEAGEEEEG